MKIRWFVTVLNFLLFFSCRSSKSEAELITETKAFDELKLMIESNNIIFDAQVAYPFQTNDIVTVTNEIMRQTENANGRFNLSANEDFLSIKQDSAKASLSFFGELRSASYSDSRDTDIEFNNVIEDYNITKNDKKKNYIYFL